MFRGINNLNIDDKGRMTIPTRYRKDLDLTADGKFILTIDTDERCLLLYALEDWEEIEKKLEKLPSFNATTRRIQRLLIGYATEVNLDNNGRILLPQVLREYAMLDRQIILVGQGKKFEIWSESNWLAQTEKWLENNSNETPEELKGLSL